MAKQGLQAWGTCEGNGLAKIVWTYFCSGFHNLWNPSATRRAFASMSSKTMVLHKIVWNALRSLSLFQGPPFFPRFVFFKGCPFQLCPLPRVVQRKTVPGPVCMNSKPVPSCGNGGFPFSVSPCSILTLAPVICQRPCTMQPSCRGRRRRCGRGWVNSRTFFGFFVWLFDLMPSLPFSRVSKDRMYQKQVQKICTNVGKMVPLPKTSTTEF